MDILSLLAIYFILATIIMISTDNVVELFKPFGDLSKYKLVIAFALTVLGVISFNIGMFQMLKMEVEASLEWFHWFDIFITILFLTGGAQSIHKLAEARNAYKLQKEMRKIE